jgi:hypothetical protein
MDFYLHGDAAPSGRFNYLYLVDGETDVVDKCAYFPAQKSKSVRALQIGSVF